MINRGNYFDVQKYLGYQEKWLQYHPNTIARKWGHLRHLLEWADSDLFPSLSRSQKSFPQYLLEARNDRKDTSLSPASMQRACLEARNFYTWAKVHLAQRYKLVQEDWVETIRPSRNRGIQSELRERSYFSLEDIRKIVAFNPERLIDERDRAATSFLFLSGMRISAFVTLPVTCVDLENQSVDQFPKEGVKTKNSKAARTFLLPVKDLLLIIESWHKKVWRELGDQSLWYPALSTDGSEWGPSDDLGSSESRRMSFSRGLRRLCKQSGVDYLSPHKIRNGHGVYGVKSVTSIEEFKAFSQNMMHESMEITDRLYGRLARNDVRKVISSLGGNQKAEPVDEELFEQFLEFQAWRNQRR